LTLPCSSIYTSAAMEDKKPLTYKDAGVDIEAGERLVNSIKRHATLTARPEVLAGIGGFAALFSLAGKEYCHPVLVSATDGVGTKLKIAQMMGKHDTVGIDLVAMSANDLVCLGAEPLFFLDYFATGHLDLTVAEEVIKGVAEGCRRAGCALVGGETAEMPDFYPPGEYDLAGFMVGLVEKEKIIDGSRIAPGDSIVGLASSGLHSNGYSLARQILFHHRGYSPQSYLPGLGISLGEELLRPTKIYVRTILELRERFVVKGVAHITGGGLSGNLPRILPSGCGALLRWGSWVVPPIFLLLQQEGNVSSGEMRRVFNLGIGMALVLSPAEAQQAVEAVRSGGDEAWIIGEVVAGDKVVHFTE
jgi:phosphoribosylformylglycinamidine cyclo-ligase